MNEVIQEYCVGVTIKSDNPRVPDRVVDCHKVVDNRCTVYNDTCRKQGGSQMLGCSFSPHEAYRPTLEHLRAGQQKQKHQDRSYTSKHSRKLKYRS